MNFTLKGVILLLIFVFTALSTASDMVPFADKITERKKEVREAGAGWGKWLSGRVGLLKTTKLV